jgi:murein DD-endopeptidase MepM/ murein hydrolase activator NlpD
MRTIGIAMALAVASTTHADNPKWPPEPLIEMRVPTAPSAFPSAGRTYLVYEVRLTNLGNTAVGVRRIEVRNADDLSAAPIAAFEAEQLDKVLQHFSNPAVGDRMPDADDGHRNLAAGETALVFLTVVLEPGARVPDRLSHRLFTADSSITGAVISAHAAPLHTLGPPLEGTSWRAYSGAGDNNSHHRRQIFVLGGHATLPNRHAIDWKRIQNGVSFSGPEGDTRSYYSYGAPVLAVASGMVVRVKDGIPDNTPGHVGAEALKLSLDTIAGNLVVLDLGEGQFAYYAHLQPGSLRVKVGKRVRRGEVLALVGNSGSSFEPHLHFEVTTLSEPMVGEGLPYLLDKYEAVTDGVPQHRRRELPTQGMIVNFASIR